MNSSILSNKQRYAVVVLSVMLSLMVVFAAANGATTISTDVNTGGTLTVSGASALSSATLSSTLAVSGLSTVAGYISTASSTAVADFNVNGATTLNSTLAVTGASTLTGAVTTNGNLVASSTSTTLKGVGVATSTPATEFSAGGSATTTLLLDSSAAGKGGCLQLKGVDGTWYHAYASTTGPLYLSAGACK